MNTFQMQCFLAVSETLNFARAAEILNITQPSITHQIQSLEAELGVQLFRRTTRKVTITPQGEALVADARSMILIENRVKKRYATGYSEYVEVLSLGLPGTQYLHALHPILQKLKEMHPHFLPEYHIESSLKLYPLLEEGSIDAFLGFRETSRSELSFKYKELCKVPVIAVTGKTSEYSPSDKSEFCSSDFIGKSLVLINPAHCPVEIIRLQDQMLEHLTPNQIFFCESVEIAITMVKSGFGFAVLPQIHLPNDHELSYLVLDDVKALSYGLFFKSLKNKPLLSDFIEFFSI